MSVLEYIFENQIKVNWDAGYLTYSDYPETGAEKNARVELELYPTELLKRIADSIRREKGITLHEPDSHCHLCDQECALNGGYRFTFDLNDYEKYKVDTFIFVQVDDPDAEDDCDLFDIGLSPDEQKLLYRILDEQLKEYGRSCEELLEESRRKMEDTI